MSLKIDNFFQIKSWSLSTKLKALHGLSLIAIVSTVCLFIYSSTFANILYASNHGLSEYPAGYLAMQCFRTTKLVLLFSAFGAILIGNIIARNALIKIREFSARMDNISIKSLHERINPSDWPNELMVLANNFNGLLDRLESSFTKLSQFSSDIAHELRNPINNLHAVTELALSNEKSFDQYRETLQANMEEHQHLSKLIENLLFLARSENGQIQTKRLAINARVEILNLLGFFQATADEKNIALECQGEGTIFVEPTLFKRVINNLLSNALKYTEHSGRIIVKIICDAPDKVSITICDSGVGIAPLHLPKVFDRFYRVDPSRASDSGGLGLGLSIVKSIIALHQADISIESELGKGTSVHLHFQA